MSEAAETADDVAQDAAQEVAERAPAQWLARSGIAARAVVYLVIAVLVIRIGASGLGGSSPKHPASGTGAVSAVGSLPGGRWLLGVLAVGLAGYVVFSILDALLHRRGRNGAERGANALVSAGAAVVYAVLCAWTVSAIFSPQHRHQQAGSQNGKHVELTARIMRWPVGPELVGLAGAVLVGIAIGFVVVGISRRFADHLDTRTLRGRTRRFVTTLGAVGYVGRALAFGLTGCWIFAAAVTFDPKKAQGLDGSLRALAHRGYGPALLFFVATGLIAFAAYLGLEARYRKI